MTVQLLLEFGAEVGATNECGRTTLYGTASSGYDVIVQRLLEHGAEVGAKIKMDGRHFTERPRMDTTR